MNKCSHITIIVHTSLFKSLLLHLEKIGINHLYSSFGRSVSISEAKRYAGFTISNNLENAPVEILNFYIPLDSQSLVIQSIIKKCRLDIPGRGSIYSRVTENLRSTHNQLICEIKKDELSAEEGLSDITVFKNLSLINCTISKGLGDEIARFLLHYGIVPVITNASGTGLRDRLGLLRITIPKEKELISIVVAQEEANNVMENIIQWGRLDRPGRGFIWQSPVSMGLVNLKTSQRNIGHAASMEQIIAAIDSLKGNLTWRQGASSVNTLSKRAFFDGFELIMQVNEGDSLVISKAILELGISGATVQHLRTLTPQNTKDNIIVPQEILKVVVTHEQILKVTKALEVKETFLEGVQIKTTPVIRAFNFKRPR
jgi:nitrogen regulatory protein PII